jgi:hypothetical protein
MGRKLNSGAEAVWRERLTRFDSGNLTVAEFCHREGVSNPSFYQWRKRLKQSNRQPQRGGRAKRGTAVKDPAGHFVPVNVVGLSEAEIELPNGMKVRVPVANVQVLRTAILAASDACREVASC